MLRRSLAVACVFVAGCVGMTTAAVAMPTTPDYFAVTVKTHQFNMCSTNFATCGSQGGATAVNLVDYFHGLDGPWSIAVEEACTADIQSIATRTGMPGYPGVARYGAAACSGGSGNYGNAVFRSGSYVAGSYAQYKFPTQDVGSGCNPQIQECRVAVCLTQGSYAGNLNICTAHLDNDFGSGTLPIAYYQAGQYRIWASTGYTSGGLILSGDFNLKPNDVPSSYNTSFFKAPSNWTWKANNLSKQIDYVWHDHAHSSADIPVAPHCDNYYSDHCYVFAKFT
jgi:hypothetical protein